MSSSLLFRPLDNIGVNGLNTQSDPTSLDASWLAEADNIVLRESGRISFRKGLKQLIPTISTGEPIGAIKEYKDTGDIIAASGNKLYTVDFSNPNTSWSTFHTTNASGSDWEIIDFNKRLYCVQQGAIPVEYNAGTWTQLDQTAHYTAPSGVTTFNPSCGTGYYGRLWVGGVDEEKDVLYYSDTLDAHKWSSGAAGYIDLKTVWGTDEIIAIEPFYGQLVIFGKHNIAIYQNPIDPNSMSLTEVIRGVGCTSRDSVQAVGDDLLFLSDTGLRSLSRTTELDKVPLTEFSINIKDTLIRHIAISNNVKSCYIEDEGVYVMSFIDANITYVFDIKHKTPNGVPRVTMWDFDQDRKPSSMAFTDSRGFLAGQTVGSIAIYDGYYDEDYVLGGTPISNSYTGSFKTIWLNLGSSAIASLLKSLKAVIEGGSGTIVGVQWYKDFSLTPSPTSSFELNPTTTGTVARYGSSGSLYGTSKYTPLYGLREYSINLTGSAKYLQLKLSAETKGYVASLQSLLLLYKQGKIR